MRQWSHILLLGLATVAFSAEVTVLDQVIAKVNGQIITQSELEGVLQDVERDMLREGLSGTELETALKEREKNLLRDRIDTLLLIQKAEDLSVDVEADVSKRLAEIQVQNKMADTDKFQSWVSEQAGMPFEDFRQEMKNGLLTQRVIGMEVGSKISIPKAEVAKYYEDHKSEFIRDERVFLREILVSTQGKSAEEIVEAEKKAADLVARARKREDFGEMAIQNSDADTAQNFGDLGSFTRGQLTDEIEDLVFNNDKGYVTDPIKIANGLLILKVEERHKAGQAELSEVEREIMEILYMPRYQPAVRAYLTELRRQAFLEIREGSIDTAAAPGKDTSWKDPAELVPETVSREELASRAPKRKRLLWLIPVPGTQR